jgi:hypothetical protein
VKKYLWQQGIERSLDQYVDAYLNLNSNTIEIDFSGLGEGEIYIIDQNNQVVNIAPIFAGDTYLIMNQPETTGYYTLIIISNEYYGEGYFCIE